MITWMQKHNKYLVITIWISTIAFIGAGAVGWGIFSSNGTTSSVIAKVGNKKITNDEFNFAYSNAYNNYSKQYQEIYKKPFTKEMAQNIRLDLQVINQLEQKAYLINYANDLGFIVTDKELAENIESQEYFQTNGSFDKNLYKKTLSNIGLTPSVYEKNLRTDILVQKVLSIFDDKKTYELEQNVFANAKYLSDRVSIKIIKPDMSKINLDEKSLKKYWEKHQGDYLSKKKFNLKIVEVKPENKSITNKELKAYFDQNKYDYADKNGSIPNYLKIKTKIANDINLKNSRKTALNKYISFKKDENLESKNISYNIDNLPKELSKILTSKPNDILKPIIYNNRYVIIKVVSIDEALPKSFEQAKSLVKVDFKKYAIFQHLKETAQKMVKSFKGDDIGFINRTKTKKIAGFSENDVINFIAQLFSSKNKKGYALLDNKLVLFEITDQKLGNISDLNKVDLLLINKDIKTKKSNEEVINLMNQLKKRYAIKTYYNLEKGN